jgi:Glycosyl hydrolases family 16
MKKHIVSLLFCALLPYFIAAQPPSGIYKLVHFNDFNKDTANIGEEIEAGYPLDNGNVTGTFSYPIKKNGYMKNGMLNLAVINEPTPHPTNPKAPARNFSASGWHEFVTFRYGYFEAKIKTTKLDHIWNCFWLMKGTGMGQYQEIDIIECMTGSPKGSGYASCSQHWWQDQNKNADKTRHQSIDFGNISLDSFHIFGCEWTPKTLKFYIDGQLRATMKNDDLHDPMYIKLDASRQRTKRRFRRKASWGSDTTTSIYAVDYIKVYQMPNTGSIYAKCQKGDSSSLINLKTSVKARKDFKYWDDLLHLAWYPQAKYTVVSAPPTMRFKEIDWAMYGGDFGFRGELTKAFLYACNVPGTYPVTIKIAFPELSDFEEEVTFMVQIE